VHLTSPVKRCGKSRLLDVIHATCYRPLIAVNISPAVLVRSIGTDPPTLLLDEIDTVFGRKASENHEDLRGILNAGHQRNRPYIRCVGVGTAQCVEEFPSFTMAALAGIGSLPDTIEDRSVIIRLRRRAPGEKVAPFRIKTDVPALNALGGRLGAGVRSNAGMLGDAQPQMPVEDRAADCWEALVAEFPALDGRSPLGFLAAIGVQQILTDTAAKPFRLCFSQTTAAAVLHSHLASLDEVAAALAQVATTAGEGCAIAGADPRFPLPAGTGADPMRRPRERYRELTDEIRRIDPHTASHWLPNLLTDLAVDQQGRAGLTPFNAPSGKQNLRTFFAKPLGEVRANPSQIRQALAGWRRVEGFTGEYLDHHVINSAADDPRGRTGAESGVPGATWLATMALPQLRVTGDGQNVAATLWHHTGRRHLMIWPLWRQPLHPPAVQALIEHPRLTPPDPRPTIQRQDWQALGIIGVYGAERQHIPGRNFAGVLAPIPVTATG